MQLFQRFIFQERRCFISSESCVGTPSLSKTSEAVKHIYSSRYQTRDSPLKFKVPREAFSQIRTLHIGITALRTFILKKIWKWLSALLSFHGQCSIESASPQSVSSERNSCNETTNGRSHEKEKTMNAIGWSKKLKYFNKIYLYKTSWMWSVSVREFKQIWTATKWF